MNKKRFLSILLTLAMLCAFIPSQIIASADGEFAISYEFYHYTPSGKNSPNELGDKIDVDNEKLETGSYVLMALKYENLSKITDYGINIIGWDMIYDPTFLEPAMGTLSNDKISKLSKEVENLNYDESILLENTNYTIVFSDVVYTADTTKRKTNYALSMDAVASADTVLNENSATIGFLLYKVIGTGTTTLASSQSTQNCQVKTFTDNAYSGTTINTAASMLSANQMLNSGLPMATIEAVAISNKPKVTVNKTYDADGELEATSTIVVDKLIDSSDAEQDIPASTVINLYKATASVNTDDEIELTKDGAAIATETVAAAAGTATFTLNTTNDTATTDYIVTATESGKQESAEVPVVAATATLDIQDADIITAYDKTSAHEFATNSHIRVYGTTDLPIDANTKVYLYEAGNDTAIADFDINAKATDATYGDYIKVDMAGRDSTKTYYLAATYANRAISPVKREVRKQSYEPDAATAEVTNNALKKSTADTILIKKIIKEDGTTQDLTASSGTKFKVYESSTATTEIDGVTYADHTTDGTFDGVLITLPAGTMTKDGKDLYVEATETDRLPSTRAKLESVKAGGEIIGLVTTDYDVIGTTDAQSATLTQADKDKIAGETGASLVPNPAKIPVDTLAADYSKYGFPTSKVAVYVKDALDDGTNIAFVDFTSWDTSVLGATKATITNGADTQDFNVEGTPDATSLDTANVALASGYTPTIKATVTKKPVIDDLADPEDVEEGDNTVPDVIVVPDGTGRDKLADYGLKNTQIAVHFSPAKADGTDIAYIDIEWNTATDLADPIAITDGSNSQDFTLTGSFKQADLDAAGVEASDFTYKPHVTIRAVKDAKVATGVVDPEFNIVPEPAAEPKTVTGTDKDDIEAKIASGDAEGFVQVIRVPEGTTVADAKAKLPAKKLPVVVKTTNGTTGDVEQSIKYISVAWDTTALPTPDTTALTVTSGLTQEYAVTGTLNAAELTAEGITLSGTVDPLAVKIIVGKAPTITLNKGNTNAADITAGRAEEDIFVFRGYTFADPGLKVTKSDGTEIADLASVPASDIKREVKVAGTTGSVTALSAFAANESLGTYFSLDSSDYSKTYEVTYTYTDPDTKIEATATRKVYAIYKKGDIDREGGLDEEITLSDFQVLKEHVFSITTLPAEAMSDALFIEKTANVDNEGTGNDILTLSDFQVVKEQVFSITELVQDYVTTAAHEMVMNAE